MSVKKLVIVIFAFVGIGLAAFIIQRPSTKTRDTLATSTPSPTVLADDTETIKTQIKAALVAKHGQNANNLRITISDIQGNYAKGGASEPGMGGGMWFAANVFGKWQLVWDGNGIITCNDLLSYPDLPNSMVPECFDSESGNMLER